MIPARGVREAFDNWTMTRESRALDDLVVNFYTPKDRPEDLVMVVVGLEAAQSAVGEIRDLRNRIVRIRRRFTPAPGHPPVIRVAAPDRDGTAAYHRVRDRLQECLPGC